MIPLIDCMFLLLVFFIYSMLSMTIHRGIQVNLPPSETDQIDRRNHISISITHDQRLFLNKQEISLSSLLGLLRSEREEDPDRPVFINADHSVRYQTIIDVLDKVRAAGLKRVSLQTQDRTNES